jgi:hypothetical protein
VGKPSYQTPRCQAYNLAGLRCIANAAHLKVIRIETCRSRLVFVCTGHDRGFEKVIREPVCFEQLSNAWLRAIIKAEYEHRKVARYNGELMDGNQRIHDAHSVLEARGCA